MPTCPKCGKPDFFIHEIEDGMCPTCRAQALMTDEQRAEARERSTKEQERLQKIATLPITTEAWVGEAERLGVVASEVVFGMNIFKDLLANLRDLVGGRSGTVQKVLKDAREAAFEELRIQATDLGADMIVAVDIDYHNISTGSAVNMMMVAVSGTAIKQVTEE